MQFEIHTGKRRLQLHMRFCKFKKINVQIGMNTGKRRLSTGVSCLGMTGRDTLAVRTELRACYDHRVWG